MLWFLFLLQAARTVLHSAEPVSQMLNDWKQIDFEGIARQALWTFSQSVEEDYELVNERKWTKPVVACVTAAPVTPAKPVRPVLTHKFDAWFSIITAEFDWLIISFSDYKEFTQLLDQQATIDQYAEWASNLVNRCVLKVSTSESKVNI